MTAGLTRPVLVLDAGYQAVNVVPLRKALVLVAAGKAVTVEEDRSLVFRSERLQLFGPVIIRLLSAIAHRVYRHFRVRFNKRNVMARDGFRCQYCGRGDLPLTIDHVVPRSRRTASHPHGGPTVWENCVTACVPCNRRKGDRTPQEAGMRLSRRPRRPPWLLPVPYRRPPGSFFEQWQKYLPYVVL